MKEPIGRIEVTTAGRCGARTWRTKVIRCGVTLESVVETVDVFQQVKEWS